MRLSYPALRRLGLGAHIAIVIALAAIPTSVLVVGYIDSERRRAIAEAEEWVQSAAGEAVDRHRAAIASTATLLEVSSRLVDAGPAAVPCRLLPTTRRVVWFMDPDGGSVCSTQHHAHVPDRLVARLAEISPADGFTVVGPYASDIGGERLFGVVTRTGANGAIWHLVRPIEVAWEPIVEIELAGPHELAIVAIDRTGRVFRHSRASGPDDLVAAADAFRPMLAVREPAQTGTLTLVDFDGVRRIYGVAGLAGPELTILVGLSHDSLTATAQRELIVGLALLAVVIGLSGLAAWLLIERMVLRSVRSLRDAAVATADGAHGRRVAVDQGPVELRQLAVAFNEMTAKLEYQALHDQLTGLANRRLVSQHLDRLVASATPFAVLALDLDGFKPVNDEHGHAIGDTILAEVAARLCRSAPPGALVGRTGGDEFVVLLPQAESTDPNEEASALADRVLDELRHPFGLTGGGMVGIGASVGIAFWPEDGATAEQVVRDADAALYAAKSGGRNRFSVFRLAGRAGEAAAPPPVQSRRAADSPMRMRS